jgi:Glycosyl hydrolase family 26
VGSGPVRFYILRLLRRALNTRTDVVSSLKRLAASRHRLVIWGLLCAAAVTAGVLLGTSSSERTSPRSPPRATSPPPAFAGHVVRIGPDGTVSLGVNLPQTSAGALDQFARLVGIKPKILMWYQGWDAALVQAQLLTPIVKAGAIPMITWDPTDDGSGIPLEGIATGRYDSYIESSAAAAKAWGGPLLIRFAHEMNLPGAAFGPGRDGNTPSIFVAAWRHVVDIFRTEGATNVQWVWSPNVYCSGSCPFTAFYPGDAWVDWVALDGYNYALLDDVDWMSFAQIFRASYAILARLTSKPMMIAETGSTDEGGSKAAWITGIGSALRVDLPRVRAIVWFDRVKEADWRVNSSPQALAAFRGLVSSPPFSRPVP